MLVLVSNSSIMNPPFSFALLLVGVSIPFFLCESTIAGPGRILTGPARKNLIQEEGEPDVTFDKVDCKIRLPRNRGPLNGVLRTVTLDPGDRTPRPG